MVRTAIAFSLASVAAGLSGEEVHCIGDRAHVATYDITGDSLDTMSDAAVTIEPAPESNELCGGKEGDRAICVGSNIDETCASAASDIPLNDIFDCKNCFAGASMDLYYKLNISAFALKGVEVGLRNNHLRGAVEVHGHKEASGPFSHGTIDLLDASKVAKISFKVGKILPVDISIGLPTALDYSLGWEGALDATAGVDLDVDLGDHFVSWTKEDGFRTQNTSTSVSSTPFVTWDSGTVGADLLLSLRSSLQVDVDKVMWYNFNMNPQVPGKVTFEHHLLQKDKLCLSADLDFDVNHEADVHFSLFGKEHDIYHFGPNDLYHYHKEEAMRKCTGKDVLV